MRNKRWFVLLVGVIFLSMLSCLFACKGSSKDDKVTETICEYDFADYSWVALFETSGNANRKLADDPAGSGSDVLSVSHNSSEHTSWIRNKTSFLTGGQKKFTVDVDLYIPSDALKASGDYVRIQLNGNDKFQINLVSDATARPGATDTKEFPRDKWFSVRFSIDMAELKYNVEIVEDGKVSAVVLEERSASSMSSTGPLNLNVLLQGANQTIYIDKYIVKASKSIADGVSFIRIDGVNAAGHELLLYGDFSGELDAKDLTGITWEKSDSYSGRYRAIRDVEGATYTPKDGGYYLRVKAKYNNKTLTSFPVYIREAAEAGFVRAYLSANGNGLKAAVVYNNELGAYNAEVKVVIYDGDTVVNTYSENFEAKQGSDLVVFTFENVDISGKRAEMNVLSNGKTICEAVGVSENLPKINVSENTSGTSVLANDVVIANFAQNRYMTFRASLENDHWIGTAHNPIDMGFNYQEDSVAGLVNTDVWYTVVPGVFKIVFVGEKTGLDVTQQNELIGFWNSDKEEFSFIYNASMTADTAVWHSNSGWAASRRIEPFDYHFERMSILDRVYNNNHNGDLYDYVIFENGKELTRIPKLPVPRYMIEGDYFYGFYLSHGESVYYPDAEEGGWKSTLLSDTADTYVEICWSWYDIHSCSDNSVPKLGNCEIFTISQSWLYETTTAEHDRELIDAAVEVEWRDLPNYQLPLFSTNNTFETQFGGTNWQYAWWKSSYDCTMDAEIGHNGAGSVKIHNKTASKASWYTEGVWGYPYSFDDVKGKTYRLSGYIKTENVVGEAYIASIQGWAPNERPVIKSKVVSGTTDWTYVSVIFTGQGNNANTDHFYLTLNGTGTVWFDDVKIEEVK